jgi:carbamate kinase
VPSPRPYEIEEFPLIARLIQGGAITICCGGGGIPVFDLDRDGQGRIVAGDRFIQSEVVIDKDRASALLAARLLDAFDGADVDLIILMEADGLYRDARCRPEDYIPYMNMDELTQFLADPSLDRGSIQPKLEAIWYFLQSGGKNAYLGPLDGFAQMFNGWQKVGTRFTQTPQLNLYQ